MGKRKFIDKKNSVSFRLLHRSQKDPLVTDQDAPQFVLQEIDGKNSSKEEERDKFGIYFDDDYDYMQHLRERGGGEVILASQSVISKQKQKKGISLPSSVFQSDVEEKIGVLNKAAPQGLTLDFDPDLPEVIAAMDEASENPSDDWLEDDFVMLANKRNGDDDRSEAGAACGDLCSDAEDMFSDEAEDMFSDDAEYDEERDELKSLEKEETKSRFTGYSLTSSVIRRNEHLTTLDAQFEKLYAEYDDSEIGAQDGEDAKGYLDINSGIMDQLIKQYESMKTRDVYIPERPILREQSDSEEEYVLVEVKQKPKWDCESIRSTYSTTRNQPTFIDLPKKEKKIKVNAMGIPVNKSKLTPGAVSKLASRENRATGPGSIASAVTQLSIRPKEETPDEKRSRKKAFREHKRERRIEKKLNRQAFMEEKRHTEKMMANNKSRFQVAL